MKKFFLMLGLFGSLANMNAGYLDDQDLLFAAQTGTIPLLISALERDAHVNVQDAWGWTALHIAAYHGDCEIAEILLADGACSSMVDCEGRTPLHWSAQQGHRSLTKLLLAYGAPVNAVDYCNTTPLDLAFLYRHFDVARILGWSPHAYTCSTNCW